jgi:hypothetical protein
MVWTTPRTWVAAELVTAAQFNTHLRDNLNALRDYMLGAQDLGSDFKYSSGRALRFSDSDVGHGMTTVEATDVWGSITQISATAGGLLFRGLSDIDSPGLQLQGIVGSATPANGAVYLIAAKKNGTGLQDIGSAESAILFQNNSVFLGRFYGAGLNVVGGASIGYSGVPTAGTLHVGDVDFKAHFVSGKPTITFNSAGAAIQFDRSNSHLDIGGGILINVVAGQQGVTIGSTLTANNEYASVMFGERLDPAAPGADHVRVYAKDNGAGKTQLVALFSSGAVQQIAIQP